MAATDACLPSLPLGELPLEVSARVLHLAGPHAAAAAATTCSAWRSAVANPQLWHAFFDDRWLPLVRLGFAQLTRARR